MRLFLSLLAPLWLSAATFQTFSWPKGFTFLNFLEAHKLPLGLYYDLDRDDKKLTEEIYSGTRYEILLDINGTLMQALIPINESLQLHLYAHPDGYKLQTTPMLLDEKREAFTFKLRTSPYNDIMHYTKNRFLAQEFVWAYKNSLNFTRDLRVGDTIAVVYTQGYRNGVRFGYPKIEAAMIEVYKKPRYIYRNSDGRYYNESGKEIEGFMLSNPVRNARITSRFSYRRFHPILKRYRAHLGIDFGARVGTPIYAAARGTVSFVGDTAGYGNVVKVTHVDGYMTLYAHMKNFRRGLKRGQSVNSNTILGYVGNSGLSTGPHLHFGLYKNGAARNPQGVIRITTKQLKGKQKEAFETLKSHLNEELALHVAANTQPVIEEAPEDVCHLGSNNTIFKPKD